MTIHRLLIVSGLAVLSACATLRPPSQTSGPAVSEDGTPLIVTRQSCQRSRNADQDDYLIEDVVEIEARSSRPLEIHRDAFRLLTPSGYRLRPISWGVAEPLVVDPARPQTFDLRFMANGGRDCTDPVKLDLALAVTRERTPVALGLMSFTPAAKY